MKIRHIIAAALMLMLAVSAVSCGGSTDTTEQTTTVPGAAETTAEKQTEQYIPTEAELYPLPKKNMEGFELRFYNYDSTWLTWACTQLDAADIGGDMVNDEIYKRNRKIESDYNCKISEKRVAKTDTNFKELMASGEDLYDITMLYDEKVAAQYSSGLILSWDILPYVDTSRSWWGENANSVFQIKGKRFAAVGDFCLSPASRGFVMIFNKDLMREIRTDESIYSMVKNGRWTLDAFAMISKDFASDIDGNGVMDKKDRYVTTGAIKLHFGSLITGSGIRYIDVNDDGDPYFALEGNERALDVLQKIFDIHNGTDIFLKLENDVSNGSTEGRTIFKEGRILINGSALYSVTQLRDTPFDFGIIPFPKYDAEQENYYTLTSATSVAAIPMTLREDRAENVAILLEDLCRDSQINLLPAYREGVLKTRDARDADSAEMLDIIFNTCTFDLGLSVWPNETYYKFMDCYLKMNDNFASVIKTQSIVVSKTLEKFMTSIGVQN